MWQHQNALQVSKHLLSTSVLVASRARNTQQTRLSVVNPASCFPQKRGAFLSDLFISALRYLPHCIRPWRPHGWRNELGIRDADQGRGITGLADGKATPRRSASCSRSLWPLARSALHWPARDCGSSAKGHWASSEGLIRPLEDKGQTKTLNQG